MPRTKGALGKKTVAKKNGGSPPVTDHAAAASKTDLTDEQLQGLTSHHVGKYKAALEAKKAAAAGFLNVCKLAKAEGVKIADIKDWIALDTEEGQKRIKEEFEARIRITRWRNFDIGHQFKLFDESDTNSFQAGKEAGMAGEVAKPPAGRDVQEWMRGHAAGQQIKMSGFKELKERDAAEFDDSEIAPPPTSAPEHGGDNADPDL